VNGRIVEIVPGPAHPIRVVTGLHLELSLSVRAGARIAGRHANVTAGLICAAAAGHHRDVAGLDVVRADTIAPSLEAVRHGRTAALDAGVSKRRIDKLGAPRFRRGVEAAHIGSEL
jgi:hypothetical protein